MNQVTREPTEASFAANAFDQLRGEVSLLRRAVERLAEEREEIEIPDYTTTLAEISERLQWTADNMENLAKFPVMQLTPKTLAQEISLAGEKVRAQDREIVHEARAAMAAMTQRIAGFLSQAVSAEQQFRREMRMLGGGAVLALTFVIVFLGGIVPALPAGWVVPERIAARILGLDMRRAGERLERAADLARHRVS